MAKQQQHPAIDILAKASKGLLFISESESPLEPFLWDDAKDVSQATVVKNSGADKDTAVEETTLAGFIRAVSSEDRPQFDALTKVIGEQLTGVKVFKIGDEAEKDVYIVGKTKDGKIAGLKTSVVET